MRKLWMMTKIEFHSLQDGMEKFRERLKAVHVLVGRCATLPGGVAAFVLCLVGDKR